MSRHASPAPLVRGHGGLEPAEVQQALGVVRDGLRAHAEHMIVLSPWVTLEEAEAARKLAADVGAQLAFVSPEPNGLEDELLHTGDPCPNRRGLEELGIAGMGPADVLRVSSSAATLTLVGERVVDLMGAEALADLPSEVRLFVFDCRALDLPSVRACVSVANWVERTGHWLNRDGQRGPISAARPAPPGVRATLSLLAELAELGAGTGAEVPAR